MTEEEIDDERGPQLFTASDIARFCQVDLKTIHNWSEKGEIRHFRTPGRHLRFRRVDVLEFLRKYGYPIPPVLRQGTPRVVALDEEGDSLAPLKRALSKRFDLTTFQDPFEALVALGTLQPDVLVLDPEMKAIDGTKLIERLREIPLTSHIRVVAITSDESKKRAYGDAGAYAVLPKSASAQLRDTLERLTGLEKTSG